MYEVYIVKNMDWEYLASLDNIKDLDEVVYKITKLRPNKALKIDKDGIELCCLNGTEYQYWLFKNKYVRGRSLGYDYVKSFIRKENEHGEKRNN